MLSDAMMGLSVENNFTAAIRRSSSGLILRERGKGHGTGMSSVAATVSRYGGTLEVTQENGVVAVNILMQFSGGSGPDAG